MEPQTAQEPTVNPTDPAADGADVVVETPASETEVVEETPAVEEKAEETA